MNKKFWFIVFSIFILIGIGISLITAEVFHRTGDVKFCSSCHLMAPMVETWKQSIHGGNNNRGIAAACADCHIDHSSMFGYTKTKVISGITDVFKNFISPPNVDFYIKNLDNYSNYVFVSGCQSCHKKLIDNEKMSHKANRMHKKFFEDLKKDSNTSCIDCHQDSRNATPLNAHPDLEELLNKMKVQKDASLPSITARTTDISSSKIQDQ